MAAKKNEKQKNTNKYQDSQTNLDNNSIKPEIISIITICVCILIIISVFSGNGQNPADFSENAIGFLGGIICWILKGSFGLGAYILPFGIIALCSSAFFSETKKIKISKFIMSVALFLILISFMHLIGNNSDKSPIECFNQGGALNGGFIGCIIGNSLYSVLGFGSYILFAFLAIILAVFITGKSFMVYVRQLYYKILDLFEKDNISNINYNDDDYDDYNDSYVNDNNYNDDYNDDDYNNYDDFTEEPIKKNTTEKKNRKINKTWAGNAKKNDVNKQKNHQEKKVVRHDGKIIGITIPEKPEKNKNKISLFTDEIAKNKKNDSPMPSFLSKNNNIKNKSKDDDNIIIKGFISDNDSDTNTNTNTDIDIDNNIENKNENYSDYIKDNYLDEPENNTEKLFESREFQEKIMENFKERFRENIENNYKLERENNKYQNNYNDFDSEDNDYTPNTFNNVRIADIENIEDIEYSENIKNIKSVNDTKNTKDIKNVNDTKNTKDIKNVKDSKNNTPNKKNSDIDKFTTITIDESDSNTCSDESSEFYDNDFNYPEDEYIYDDFETNENLQQAVFEYFNGNFGDLFDSKKNKNKFTAPNIKNPNIKNNEKINMDFSKNSYNQNYKIIEDEPEIFQAGKQNLLKENLAQKEVPKKEYVFPPISFLDKNPDSPNQSSKEEILENSRILIKTLSSFNVEAKVNEISKGPTVTRYEISPGEGIKVSKILGLADNLALSLAAKSIRIEAPIPGKSAVGIEIPNKEITTVYLSEVICDPVFQEFPSKLAFGLGKDITGNVIVTDIAKMPHMLIAGRTGSGKSVCINTLITSIIYKATPDEVKLIMIDPKVVELSVYNGIPHLLIPVVTEPEKAAGALNWSVSEMMLRYQLFAKSGVRNLAGYNKYLEENNLKKLPQIIVIIDELADLMMVASKEVESAICRLAQLARAAGIHLIIATQRPSVDVITGLIKANIPSRISFAVSSSTDSRTILDMGGADKLLGMGDMLFKSIDKPLRIQGAFISDKEVEKIVSFLKENNPTVYDEELIEKITNSSISDKSGNNNNELDNEELINKAIAFVVKKETVSCSMLQKKFKIGYNKAARIIEELEERGIIGSDTGTSKTREVLMNRYEYEDYMERRRDYI